MNKNNNEEWLALGQKIAYATPEQVAIVLSEIGDYLYSPVGDERIDAIARELDGYGQTLVEKLYRWSLEGDADL